MTSRDDRPTPARHRNPADACLARTADAIDFASPSTGESSAAAERRIDPFRRVLAGLLRGFNRR